MGQLNEKHVSVVDRQEGTSLPLDTLTVTYVDGARVHLSYTFTNPDGTKKRLSVAFWPDRCKVAEGYSAQFAEYTPDGVELVES